jgi:D-aminoacyl-tRNA deacylase
MKFEIIASRKDEAGMNIAQALEALGFKVNYYDKEIINAEQQEKIWQDIGADFIVFISKHQGKQEKMLSMHAPGNWRKADYGGVEGKICSTSSRVLKIFFQELNKNIPQGWQATLECTHHGPLIEKPCLFIEIGSSAKDWPDKDAGKAIAKTVKDAIEKVNNNNENYTSAIGLGGPHYCSNFNKIQLNNKEYSIGHIIPEYALPLTVEMLNESVRKTLEKTSLILLDWKGLGNSESRKQVLSVIEEAGLSYKRTSEIEK